MCTEHLLLGLVMEDTSKGGRQGEAQRGCLGPVELEAARAEVEVLSGKRRGGRNSGSLPEELPFSQAAKRVFEAALTVRCNRGF